MLHCILIHCKTLLNLFESRVQCIFYFMTNSLGGMFAPRKNNNANVCRRCDVCLYGVVRSVCGVVKVWRPSLWSLPAVWQCVQTRHAGSSYPVSQKALQALELCTLCFASKEHPDSCFLRRRSHCIFMMPCILMQVLWLSCTQQR